MYTKQERDIKSVFPCTSRMIPPTNQNDTIKLNQFVKFSLLWLFWRKHFTSFNLFHSDGIWSIGQITQNVKDETSLQNKIKEIIIMFILETVVFLQ